LRLKLVFFLHKMLLITYIIIKPFSEGVGTFYDNALTNGKS